MQEEFVNQIKVSEVFTSRETKTWPLKEVYANCCSHSPVLIPACRCPGRQHQLFFLHPSLSSAPVADPWAPKGHSYFFFFLAAARDFWDLSSPIRDQTPGPIAVKPPSPNH